jgi:hypothetical protein
MTNAKTSRTFAWMRLTNGRRKALNNGVAMIKAGEC